MSRDRQRAESQGGAQDRSVRSTDGRARVLAALAEPNRMRIVELLRTGPRTVGEIAERLGLRQPQTSKHLKVLADAGVVEVTADANRRIYALRPDPFRSLDAWLRSFRAVTAERLDDLDDYLRQLQGDPGRRQDR